MEATEKVEDVKPLTVIGRRSTEASWADSLEDTTCCRLLVKVNSRMVQVASAYDSGEWSTAYGKGQAEGGREGAQRAAECNVAVNKGLGVSPEVDCQLFLLCWQTFESPVVEGCVRTKFIDIKLLYRKHMRSAARIAIYGVCTRGDLHLAPQPILQYDRSVATKIAVCHYPVCFTEEDLPENLHNSHENKEKA